MKKINLPQFKKIDWHKILDAMITHLKLIAISISLIVIISFGLFLYRDFYLTIISAREIVLLENEVSAITINIDALNSVEQKHEQKQSLIIRDWSDFDNIFYKSNNIIAPAVNANKPDTIIDAVNNEENISPVTSF